MFGKLIGSIMCLGFLGSSLALAGDNDAAIASAESAGPASVTANSSTTPSLPMSSVMVQPSIPSSGDL